MAENPIVVFFCGSQTVATLPCAFSPNGKSFDPSKGTCEALLLVLNDEADVPCLQHTNRTNDAPLGIIWHNENDAKKKALEKYGQPIRLSGFSHVPGNRIFDSMKAILESGGTVVPFVEEWRAVIAQSNLDELAALITYMALLPAGTRCDALAYSRYEAISGRCQESLSQRIRELVSKGQYLDAVGVLERTGIEEPEAGGDG